MAELKKIEDKINVVLSGETQKNSLDFIAFMRTNGFSFEGFDMGDDEVGWNPIFKEKSIGCIMVSDQLMFWLGLDWCFDDNGSVSDDLKDFTWSHVVNCPQEPCKPPYCEGDNHSKNHWKIFEKEFESTCHSPLAFFGPDAKTLDNIKKLLLMTK